MAGRAKERRNRAPAVTHRGAGSRLLSGGTEACEGPGRAG